MPGAPVESLMKAWRRGFQHSRVRYLDQTMKPSRNSCDELELRTMRADNTKRFAIKDLNWNCDGEDRRL
jgi:hypothetical protein